jgi:long-chain fatty acid transport protein
MLHKRRLRAGLALALVSCLAAEASAGGMYLPTRGVRPTGRGGAFVAGADDLHGLWYNPAGLALIPGEALLADATLVSQSIEYTRIDSGGNVADPVDNQSPGLPIPSLGYARQLGKKAVLAAGVWAPFSGLAKFDEDGPQRYSNIDLSKSVIATVGVGVGVRIGDNLRIGATLQDHIVALETKVMLSGCPGETVCAPEDPDFDSLNRIDQNSYLNPSGSVGVQVDVHKNATLGAAFQLPVFVRGKGTLHTRLPASGFFDGASVEGDRADIKFDLPPSIRAGLELRPGRWKVELATTIEMWSQHDEMSITPKGVRIVNAAGVGTYELGPMILPRKFKTTVAAHLGVEGRPSATLPLTVRLGYIFETGAPPDKYLTVLTVDGQKHIGTLGAGYAWGTWSFDVVAAFAKMGDRTVAAGEGESPLLNPIRDESDEPLRVYVNDGDYKSAWLMLGGGASRSW